MMILFTEMGETSQETGLGIGASLLWVMPVIW